MRRSESQQLVSQKWLIWQMRGAKNCLAKWIDEVDKVASLLSPEDLRALEGEAACLKDKVTDCDADASLSFVMDGTRMFEVKRTIDGIYSCGHFCRQFVALRMICKHTLAIAEKHQNLAVFLNGVKSRLAAETFSDVMGKAFDRQSGSKPSAGRRGRPVSAGPRKPPTQLQMWGAGALAALNTQVLQMNRPSRPGIFFIVN